MSGSVQQFLPHIRQYIPDVEIFFEGLDSRAEINNRLSWIGEMVSDFVDIIFGPFAFNTFVKVFVIEPRGLLWNRVHPSPTMRLFFMKEILNSMGFGSEVESKWNTWINGVPPGVRREFEDNEDKLRSILEFVNGFLVEEGHPIDIFSHEDYSRSKEVAEIISRGQTVKNEKASVILNASLIAIDGGFDKLNVNRVVIESLYQKRISRVKKQTFLSKIIDKLSQLCQGLLHKYERL